ncbi:MAG: glycine cleavage system protein GcvH [Thermoplasmatota archaeon]
MPELPDDMMYTENHEWIKKEKDVIRYGITDYAQEELGDIVYVELPMEDEEFEKGDVIGVIESVKTVSDLYAPVSGQIKKVNSKLEDSPELINDDPYGDGWITTIEIEDEAELEQLLSAEKYETHTE